MNPVEQQAAFAGSPADRLTARPRTLAETGLSQDFLADLISKHLLMGGVLDLHQLAERTALAGSILEQVLNALRKESRVEIRSATENSTGLRYAMTERGRTEAMNALLRSGYMGPAPVPLRHYEKVVLAQSVHRCTTTRKAMKEAFADVVISENKLNQLGPAVHSGRAIMVYGHAGTGKTYICKRLARLLGDDVFIPQAIAVGDEVIQFFDPILHRPVSEKADGPGLHLQEGHDPRYVLCRRPVAISGGELTLDMLELDYDPATRQSHAPMQFKANNGLYIVDDLGRQRVPAVEILNRWIVPMEEKLDYLTLGTGKRFPVPFDVVLIFSTNLNPTALADEAFIRRLGYKIRFDPISAAEYRGIWRQVCEEYEIESDPALLDYVFALYSAHKKPLLPCHPRDLLGLALDQSLFQDNARWIAPKYLQLAWESYFVNQYSDGKEL